MLFIVGCSSGESPETKTEAPTQQVVDTETDQVTEPKTSTISEEKALDTAKTIIEQLKATIESAGPQYEGDEDYTLEKPDISPYATTQYIDNHFSDELYNCEAEDCSLLKTPQDIYFGWNPTITIKDNSNFELQTLFNGYFVHEDVQSYLQTVHFRLEDDTWKVQDFSQTKQDMNLTMTEVEDYLKAYAFDNIRDINESSIVVDGVDEPAAEFVDNYTERPFYIVLRTGHILSDTDEFSL